MLAPVTETLASPMLNGNEEMLDVPELSELLDYFLIEFPLNSVISKTCFEFDEVEAYKIECHSGHKDNQKHLKLVAKAQTDGRILSEDVVASA